MGFPLYKMGGSGPNNRGLGNIKGIPLRFDTANVEFRPRDQREFFACEDLVKKGLASVIPEEPAQVDEPKVNPMDQIDAYRHKLEEMDTSQIRGICFQNGIRLERGDSNSKNRMIEKIISNAIKLVK